MDNFIYKPFCVLYKFFGNDMIITKMAIIHLSKSVIPGSSMWPLENDIHKNAPSTFLIVSRRNITILKQVV